MYVFLIFFPVLYILLLYALRILSLPAKATVQLLGVISILNIPIAVLVFLLFRFFIAKAYTLFTIPYIALYTFFALLPYLHALFYTHTLLRRTSFWPKEGMLISLCVLEFWFALGSLLIASHFFTYVEYFLHPLLRMSIVMTGALGVLSRRRHIHVVAASVMVAIGIVTTFLAIYAYSVQALLLVFMTVLLHGLLLLQYTFFESKGMRVGRPSPHALS